MPLTAWHWHVLPVQGKVSVWFCMDRTRGIYDSFVVHGAIGTSAAFREQRGNGITVGRLLGWSEGGKKAQSQKLETWLGTYAARLHLLL